MRRSDDPSRHHEQSHDDESDSPVQRVVGENEQRERDDAGGEKRPADCRGVAHADRRAATPIGLKQAIASRRRADGRTRGQLGGRADDFEWRSFNGVFC